MVSFDFEMNPDGLQQLGGALHEAAESSQSVVSTFATVNAALTTAAADGTLGRAFAAYANAWAGRLQDVTTMAWQIGDSYVSTARTAVAADVQTAADLAPAVAAASTSRPLLARPINVE